MGWGVGGGWFQKQKTSCRLISRGKNFLYWKKSVMTYNHGKYYFTQLHVGEKNSITWGLEKNIHSHSNHPQKSNGWSLMVKFISLFPLTNEINQQKVPHSCVPSCQGYKTFCSLSVAVYSSQAMGLLKISFTNSTLSDPESCFSTIKLPLHENDYQAFETSMNIAVNCQHQGYGRGWSLQKR